MPDTRLYFDSPEVGAAFRVDSAKRTITGMVVPWGQTAVSGFSRWKFKPGSLTWADLGRVKMNRDHSIGRSFARAVSADETPAGLVMAFKVARGPEGDEALALAEDGVLDGLSIHVAFESEDAWRPDPVDRDVRLVESARLTHVALTAEPAFDDARVASVAASRSQEGSTMPDENQGQGGGTATVDMAQFTADLTQSIREAVGEALTQAFSEQPERQPVAAGRVQVTYEPPVYNLKQSATAPSFVRDIWRAGHERDEEAYARFRKFVAQQADIAQKCNDVQALSFATGTTGNLAQIIPPGYRPELYVPQLFQERPLVSQVSKGEISDATPFTVPRSATQSGMAANHVEGTNPTDGTLTMGTITVTPGAVSGLFKVTREIVDASNPAIDAIALQAMREAYSQNTEGKVYTELNGANGVGGTITAGFVPSGSAAVTATGAGNSAAGAALLDAVRVEMAKFPFRRFAPVTRLVLSQEGVVTLVSAKDSAGRALLAPLGPQNAVGTVNSLGNPSLGLNVDGLIGVPAWSMTGNAAGDADAILFNHNDVWAWESPTLTFRYEERNGPAVIDLALFGYFAVRILRPLGFTGVRLTVT